MMILFFFWKSVAALLDINRKYCKMFYWFPNYLFYIDHGNTKFSYIYTIEMRKSSFWKTSKWNDARLIQTINKNNNKNNIKNKDRINKAFKGFSLSKKTLSSLYITKIFPFYTLILLPLTFFWLEQSTNTLKSKAS